jgi:hypothetical protein
MSEHLLHMMKRPARLQEPTRALMADRDEIGNRRVSLSFAFSARMVSSPRSTLMSAYLGRSGLMVDDSQEIEKHTARPIENPLSVDGVSAIHNRRKL